MRACAGAAARPSESTMAYTLQNRLLVCSLCGREQHYRSTQKGVGAGWRVSKFLVRNERLWFCPAHIANRRGTLFDHYGQYRNA